jgi:hypothetical protein
MVRRSAPGVMPCQWQGHLEVGIVSQSCYTVPVLKAPAILRRQHESI